MIIVDTREPWEKMFKLASKYNVDCRLETLHHGCDYEMSSGETTFGVQRKEVNDFVKDLGKLKDDLADLRDHYDLTALLIEGKWDRSHTDRRVERGYQMTPVTSVKQWQNFCLSQQMRGTLLIYTHDESETIMTLGYAEAWLQRGMTPPRSTTPEPHLLLTQIPSVGPVTAGSIVETYGSVYDALGHIDQWEDVDGVGPKTHEEIRRFLNGS